jgi:hypothetical protein
MANWNWITHKPTVSRNEAKDIVHVTLPSILDGTTNSYAKELRAVGQALEKFRFTVFDLRRENGIYTVTGRVAKDLEETFSLIAFVRNLVRGGKAVARRMTSANSIEIAYSAAEMIDLDAIERGKRKHSDKMPDPYSISQILRGAGAFLDHRTEVTLSRITFDEKWITVCYRTAQGDLEQEKQDLEYFYDYWVKMYLRRSNRPQIVRPSEPTLFVQWEAKEKTHKLSNTSH